MKQIAQFKLVLLTILMIGFTACQDKSEVEFYLPGTWYTEQAIDYGDSSVWGSGTQLIFSASGNQGIIGTEISSEFLIFTWRWHNEGYNTLELKFMDGTYAYINGIEASSNRLTGTWYNSYWEFEDRIDGQTFRMRRID
ncbi:MAG: hypothetical protein ACRC3Z_05690 [Phocaeicola sp.]